jgi:hypothetical protein
MCRSFVGVFGRRVALLRTSLQGDIVTRKGSSAHDWLIRFVG